MAVVVTMLVATQLPRAMGIRVADVPTFGLQCKLTNPSHPTPFSTGYSSPASESEAVFFFGDRGDMNTLDKNRGESTSSAGVWSEPQLNMTTDMINRTAHVRPILA
eukprot:SAG11_NODE_9215_length_932_cov_1.362545_1_plen_106_part_00